MDKQTEQLEKNLRQKFVWVSFSVVSVVLFVISLLVNGFNYVQVENKAGALLDIIVSNGGVIPRPVESPSQQEQGESVPPSSTAGPDRSGAEAQMPSRPEQNGGDSLGKFHIFQPISPSSNEELSFSTRYFTVSIDTLGEVVHVNTTAVQRVSPMDAVDMALEVHNSGRETELVEFFYCSRVLQKDGNSLYVFVDVNEDLFFFQSFLYSSLAICFFALCGVLFLLICFSRKAVSPIVEAYARQKQFITEMSHELKTPLAVVKANTEVVELEHGDSPWTQSIHKQIEKLNYLIIRLLSLAKLEEEATKAQWKDFSLSHMVQEAGESISVVLNQQGKTLELCVEENVTFYGDALEILQLLDILLENASKYSLPQSQITMSLRRGKHSVVIAVKNTCGALKKGSHDQWFQRFYREESSRNSETGGFGLGLPMARNIVKNHDGKISATSLVEDTVEVKIEFRLHGANVNKTP